MTWPPRFGMPHPQALEVANRVDLLPEPSRHLRRRVRDGAGNDIEGCGGLFPELEPVALVEPRGHALGIHAERNGAEPLERRLPVLPVLGRCHVRLDLAPRCGLEEVEWQGELAGGEDLNAEPAPAHLLDDLRQPQGHRLLQERRRPGRGHAQLDLRLRDDGGRGHNGHRASSLREEPAPVSGHERSLSTSANMKSRAHPAFVSPTSR